MLQLLVHFRRHAEVLDIRIGNWLPVCIACFSAEGTTPAKSLAEYDQVLQLGPLVFPNQSGVKLFGSTSPSPEFDCGEGSLLDGDCSASQLFL